MTRMVFNDNHSSIEDRKATTQATMTSTTDIRKTPDLTREEAAFLRALLLDDDGPSKKSHAHGEKPLDDKVLFSLPFHNQESSDKPTSHRRRNTQLLNLWKAFGDGVNPKMLVRHASSLNERQASKGRKTEANQESLQEDDCSAKSDEEVRVERGEIGEHDDVSSCSSWGEDESGEQHYDSWEVLKDEYAEDFGFDYKEKLSADPQDFDDDQGHVFRILGTSANDTKAHPHVLSPPLMDALMSFIPEELENQNYWLKYSLIRDGSSMSTLKHYVRASSNTILAIETTSGHVFGAFTTSPWRTQFGFFGQGDGAFLWRMRHNRDSQCHSLFEQAQLETEIDVYAYSGENKLVQRCSHNEIAIGGGNINAGIVSDDDSEEMEDTAGFGIAIDEFLARGTTSPCATFRNPSLLHNLGEAETFEVANLEVWSLTPAYDVNQAEKLEMTKYFINQSSHTESSIHSVYSDIAGSYTPPSNSMNAVDMVQASFYRRVGQNDGSEEQRDRWQRSSMMGLV